MNIWYVNLCFLWKIGSNDTKNWNMVIGNIFEVNDDYDYNSFLKCIGFNILENVINVKV